eukprot:353033-Chlamydomonas_euryale.AAC.16
MLCEQGCSGGSNARMTQLVYACVGRGQAGARKQASLRKQGRLTSQLGIYCACVCVVQCGVRILRSQAVHCRQI